MQITTFTNGTVRFVPGNPAKDAWSETKVQGTVTITNNHQAVAEVPDHFLVHFTIHFAHQSAGQTLHDYLGIDVAVLRDAAAPSYSEIETAGAEQLPAVLRSLADAVQADLERVAVEKA